MEKSPDPNYSEALADRLRYIMETIGLELPGFALFIGKSESHVYSLLSGRRGITNDIAKDLGSKLEFDGSKIFKLNQPIPSSIINGKYLNNFKQQYINNPEYFVSTKIDRKLSYYVQFELVNTDLFDSPRYVWEVNDVCRKFGKVFKSDTLSKILKHLVTKGVLQSKKEPIKLRNGSYGSRKVDVFFKPDSFN